VNQKRFLSEAQLAGELGISKRTLQGDRQKGEGIPYVKLGKTVRYDWATVLEHLKKSERISTSDAGAAA